jgi:DNA-binding transcriptional regulator GbsR (MarR family)
MPYEAGSKECRHLIEAKENLLSAMQTLSNINSTDLLQVQIKEIYNKLEKMHDKRKKIESATNYL